MSDVISEYQRRIPGAFRIADIVTWLSTYGIIDVPGMRDLIEEHQRFDRLFAVIQAEAVEEAGEMMTKLYTAEFRFDDGYAVEFHPNNDIVLVFRSGHLVGQIPNPHRKWGGRRLKPRVSDALQAIEEAVPPKPKLVTSDEPKRKKTTYEPPPKLSVFTETNRCTSN